jgi:hypothetical protein
MHEPEFPTIRGLESSHLNRVLALDRGLSPSPGTLAIWCHPMARPPSTWRSSTLRLQTRYASGAGAVWKLCGLARLMLRAWFCGLFRCIEGERLSRQTRALRRINSANNKEIATKGQRHERAAPGAACTGPRSSSQRPHPRRIRVAPPSRRRVRALLRAAQAGRTLQHAATHARDTQS